MDTILKKKGLWSAQVLAKSLPNSKFYIVSLGIFVFFWGCSAIRHALLMSNAYDLGLFDQWVWLVSNGFPPYSTMEGVHLLADHGAWILYLVAIPYKFYSSIHWLLASQAFALSITALPIWLIGRQAGLDSKFCWVICGFWWLQPVVFNVNIFDFHPEVYGMPFLALTYLASRSNRPLLWFISLFIFLGCRDGLVLIIFGLGLEQICRRKWIWAVAAIGLSLGWLAMLNRWLYPMLTGHSSGPRAVANLFSYLGNTLDEVILNLITRPGLLVKNVDWVGGIIYLLLISIAVAPFLRKSSLPVLLGCLPLVVVNLLSEEAPQRTLIHHYSLPIALIVVVALIDSVASSSIKFVPWKMLGWSALCWAALAKPWFFTGPYLTRITSLPYTYQAFSEISEASRVSTTSYLVPHLSQRLNISFPKIDDQLSDIDNFDTLLLNPKDPGWGSHANVQEKFLDKAKELRWSCKSWKNGLEMCSRN